VLAPPIIKFYRQKTEQEQEEERKGEPEMRPFLIVESQKLAENTAA